MFPMKERRAAFTEKNTVPTHAALVKTGAVYEN